MLDLSGQNLGPFEIKSLIGTGGFATVYLANDKRLQSEVAVKILADNHALDPVLRGRFIAEANALRRVDSPSVVKLYDIRETDDGRPYIVLEYADRGDLVRRRLARSNNGWTPSAGDVRCVVDAVADALGAVHAQGLVHRDVTPSNLLIRSGNRQRAQSEATILEPGERFILADMGLVKDMADGSGLTVGGGTAGFWAPEQQQSWTTIDHRADIFSATALVVWFMSGQSLTGGYEMAVESIGAAWSGVLARTLTNGMASDPVDRQQSIYEWQDQLHVGLSENPGTEVVEVTRVMPGQRAQPYARNRRSKSIVAGGIGVAVLVGSGAVGALLVTGGGSQEARTGSEVSSAVETDSIQATLVADSTQDSVGASNSSVVIALPQQGSSEQSVATPVPVTSTSTTTVTTTTATTTTATTTTVPTSTTEPDYSAIPAPSKLEVSFRFDGEESELWIRWGILPVPVGVIGSQIEIAVDGGEWVKEIDTKYPSSVKGRGLAGTGPDSNPTPVARTSEYKTRVRWRLANGAETPWSDEVILEAES